MVKGKPAAETGTLRERLLNSALAEFGDKGFAGARVEEIASSAGASKQGLYHHFGSKEGIFAATVEEAYRRLRAPDQAIRTKVRKLDAEDALRTLIENLFKPSIGTVRFQRIMHDENRFEAIHLRGLAEAKSAYADLLQTIQDILDRGEKAGVFRSGIDAKQLYVFLAGVLVYRLTNAHTLSAMLGLRLDDEEGARLSRQNAIELILDGLRPVRP